MKKMIPAVLMVLLSTAAFTATANTNRLIIEDGSSALSNEAARQDKEQWNDTRMLRNKVNTRVEKSLIKPIVRLIPATSASRASISTPTGSPTPCVVWIAVPVAR